MGYNGPMISLVHGDQTARSRLRLSELIQLVATPDTTCVKLEAKSLTPAQLEQALGSHSLFASNLLVCLEGLLSLPQSSRKKQLIELVKQKHQHDPEITLILWEGKQLTPAALKAWPEAHVEEFKISKKLFAWLESINPGPQTLAQQLQLLHQVLEQDDAWFCLTLLTRQLRLLIQVKAGGQPAGPPFLVAKLGKQARLFELSQLLSRYDRLLALDRRQKTGQTRLSLAQELDLWLLSSVQ